MEILAGILALGIIVGVCAAFARRKDCNIGGNVGNKYMKEHWGFDNDK